MVSKSRSWSEKDRDRFSDGNKAGMEEETRALDLARNGVAGGNGVNIDDAGKRLIGGCLTRTMHMLRSIRRD